VRQRLYVLAPRSLLAFGTRIRRGLVAAAHQSAVGNRHGRDRESRFARSASWRRVDEVHHDPLSASYTALAVLIDLRPPVFA